jgi:hypothetical protein
MNISQKIRKGIIATVLVSSALTLTTTTPASAEEGDCIDGTSVCVASGTAGSGSNYRFSRPDKNLKNNRWDCWLIACGSVGGSFGSLRSNSDGIGLVCLYGERNYQSQKSSTPDHADWVTPSGADNNVWSLRWSSSRFSCA